MNFYDVLFNKKYGRKRGDFFDQIFSAGEPTPPMNYLYYWDFKKSLVDIINGEEFELFLGATRDSKGINFTGNNQGALWAGTDFRGKTLEIKMGDVDFESTINSTDIGFICTPIKTSNFPAGSGGRVTTPLYWQGNTGWGLYGSSTGYDSTTSIGYSLYTETGNLQGKTAEVFNYFSNKTIKIIFSDNGMKTDLYVDDIFEGTIENRCCLNEFKQLSFGNGAIKGSAYYDIGWSEARFYNMTIESLKIYENTENL